ncbi:SDR family NAD(P)-dependent oxidoreductase [Campylobacter sp. VTCC 70190]|uniref:SDR family NAD(P)-dependent oxidoreductase n=1 Tax=Campylobacter sp. VTCC 70190 TaxID=3392118 RepID=UPI00398F4B9A
MQKIIIITGTRKGIGKQLSEYYLSLGHIVCGCSRGISSINHLNYRHFELDVSDEKKVISMVYAVRKEFSRIDVLLNNAGIASMNHILTTPYKSIHNIFNTNVFGTFLFTREVAKVMANVYKKQYKNTKTMPFRIVNFTTVATPLRLEGEAIYAASKAALVNLTQVCAKELNELGITVNAVGPTPVPTDLIKNVPQNKLQDLLNQQAIKRFGKFEDVLNVIEFFLSEKSDFISSQVIYLGGVNA